MAKSGNSIPKVKINAAGECFKALIDDLAIAPGMNRPEADRVEDKAIETVKNLVDRFDRLYGKGRLKRFGQTKKLPKPRKSAPAGDTGLIYGKVQSGKTNVAVASVALALANNFRLFIVLTSDNLWLGEQTYDRFKEGLSTSGPRVAFWGDWKSDPRAWGRGEFDGCLEDGLVLVCTKNKRHLTSLLSVLKAADYDRVPALIIDDEADNASLNTFANKVPSKVSAINKAIGDLRERAFYSLYLQVTATPQCLLLQGSGHDWQPQFFIKLDPGSGYMGGNLFFGTNIKADEDPATTRPEPHVALVDFTDITNLNMGRRIQPSLELAICTFLVGFAHKKLKEPKAGKEFSFLIHTSFKQGSHNYAYDVITKYLKWIKPALSGAMGARAKRQALDSLNEGWKVLRPTCPGISSLNAIVKELQKHLTAASLSVVNATSASKQPKYVKGLNFLIGGNKFGRGVTIKGLMVTYYGRFAQSSQMDTVHQHARMFGYRKDLKDVTRLFLPREIYNNFRKIHFADEATRREIFSGKQNRLIPVWIGRNLRPSRANVLPLANISGITLRDSSHPWDPEYLTSKVAKVTRSIDKFVSRKRLKPNTWKQKISVREAADLISMIPVKEQVGTWRTERIASAFLRLAEAEKITDVRVYYIPSSAATRNLKSNARGFVTSAIKKLKPKSEMCIVLQKVNGDKKPGLWDGSPFFVPTIFWPKTNYAIVYNE